MRVFVLLVIASCSGRSSQTSPPPATQPVATAPPAARELRAPSAFVTIADPGMRSQALFAEASRVLIHPRCVNCHPPDDTPRQGDAHMVHDPPVARGVPALACSTCHQDRNAELARIPGAPGWKLAPLSMVWLGRTPAQICEQIKDPARNGGKSLAEIRDHIAHDGIVAWGWAPGADREPVPGTQAALSDLFDAWIATGAVCPLEPKP